MARADANIRIGPDGRLVIPASVTKRLGWKPGDTLVVRVQERSLLLEKRETALA